MGLGDSRPLGSRALFLGATALLLSILASRNYLLQGSQPTVSRVTSFGVPLELGRCSISGSNCCFLTCIQISQEAGQVVWYSHLFQKFPQFVVIHTVKGFGIVNKTEVDGFLELFCFSMIQWMLTIWSLVPLPFLNSAWHLEVHRSCTVEAWLGNFWALFC